MRLGFAEKMGQIFNNSCLLFTYFSSCAVFGGNVGGNRACAIIYTQSPLRKGQVPGRKYKYKSQGRAGREGTRDVYYYFFPTTNWTQ